MLNLKLVLSSFLFLFPQAVLANIEADSRADILEVVSGSWANEQRLKCLGGRKPYVKPNVILNIEQSSQPSPTGSIRLQVNKQVIPFGCFFPGWVQNEKFLTVDYTFDLLTTDSHLESAEKQRNLEKLNDMLYFYRLIKSADFILHGVGSAPDAYQVNTEVMYKCNAFTTYFSPISFPDYFSTEISRSYVIDLEEDSLKIYFTEDLICPGDVTVMSFKKQ